MRKFPPVRFEKFAPDGTKIYDGTITFWSLPDVMHAFTNHFYWHVAGTYPDKIELLHPDTGQRALISFNLPQPDEQLSG